ncbi:MAG TPA: hypothetical protein VK783_10020 [Bacteroidia bacterium]|jgi:hypothetical protein|nr:hypothetical protein [Bacteroidia bacterium]
MIAPFEYIEIIEDEGFDENTINLSIAKNPTPKIILLRGLIGSIKIKHYVTQTEFPQTIDYVDLNNRNTGILPIERLRGYVSSEISIEDLCNIFRNKKFLHQNQHFFERLVNEFSNYYYYEFKNSHTTAFAYLYRILETISYSFPLIYSSKTDDFKETYNFLKEWLSGNKDKGELGFFKKFVKVTFSNDPLIESSITIDINAPNEEIQQSFFDSFKKACSDESFFAEDTEEPRKLSVKFTEYSSFIICLRNRFFHLLNSGQPNLQSEDILDSDHFFSLVNKPTAYWLSLILFEVFKHSIENSIDIGE